MDSKGSPPVQTRLDKALGTWVKSGQSSGVPARAWEDCNFLSSWEPADMMKKVLEGSGLVFKQRKQADFRVYSQGVRCRQWKVFSQSFWRSLLTAGETFWMWESPVEMLSPCTLWAMLGRGLGSRELLLHQRPPCFSLRCPGWQGKDLLSPGPQATPCPSLTLLVL